MPLDARQFHKRIRADLGPLLSDLGFERAPKMAGRWIRPAGDGWLVVNFKVSWFNDRSRSQHFTIEIWGAGLPSTRLPTLLSSDERAELLRLENRVTSKLAGDGWRPREKPYYEGEDVWFQHWDEDDVRDLIDFLKRVLPAGIDHFSSRAAEPKP